MENLQLEQFLKLIKRRTDGWQHMSMSQLKSALSGIEDEVDEALDSLGADKGITS